MLFSFDVLLHVLPVSYLALHGLHAAVSVFLAASAQHLMPFLIIVKCWYNMCAWAVMAVTSMVVHSVAAQLQSLLAPNRSLVTFAADQPSYMHMPPTCDGLADLLPVCSVWRVAYLGVLICDANPAASQ
jgi:hypothetical protein